MKTFRICTIINDINQYSKMKTSFINAGFDEERCRYSIFDNSRENYHDPYAVLSEIQQNSCEPYIILCHQDILLPRDSNYNRLIQLLNDLEELDPNWAIVGNAGINKYYQFVGKVSDPHNMMGASPLWNSYLPERVQTLDENFLLIKSAANFSCSYGMKGFHFYGSDMCLNAIKRGYSCYVVDFHMIHLGIGNGKSLEFMQVKSLFEKKWRYQFRFCYIKTTIGVIIFSSCFRFLHQIFSNTKIKRWCFSSSIMARLVDPYGERVNIK